MNNENNMRIIFFFMLHIFFVFDNSRKNMMLGKNLYDVRKKNKNTFLEGRKFVFFYFFFVSNQHRSTAIDICFKLP